MDYVGEIKLGNKLIFEEVYYRYHERFYFYVLKHTSSEIFAEEIVQMSFIQVWEKRAALSSSFPIEVQIARIARSLMIDGLRKKATERKAFEVIRQNTRTITSGDPAADKQLVEKVSATIQSLPPECKKIFTLSREEGLSYNEIANQLSISPKTVENQISKALKAVRKVVALNYILTL